jgi:dTDP-4-dehydrorhamnose 3,5-epimerase
LISGPIAPSLALDGVRLVDLDTHRDPRGQFTEIFRREWDNSLDPIQWNLVSSGAGVLRGVHVHRCHDDYLLVAQGRAFIGLLDLRLSSPTHGVVQTVTLDAARLQAIFIPHGVAHGFYFPVPSIHIYSVTTYWDISDELGCHWADPDLAIPFPCDSPLLSPRDAALPSLAALRRELNGA